MRVTKTADLSRIVKDRRRELALTQHKLAERSGVTRQLVARFENGTGEPALSSALRILAELDLHVDVSPSEGRPFTPRTADWASLVPALDTTGIQRALARGRGA